MIRERSQEGSLWGVLPKVDPARLAHLLLLAFLAYVVWVTSLLMGAYFSVTLEAPVLVDPLILPEIAISSVMIGRIIGASASVLPSLMVILHDPGRITDVWL